MRFTDLTEFEKSILSDTSLSLKERASLVGIPVHTARNFYYRHLRDEDYLPKKFSDYELSVLKNPDLTNGEVSEELDMYLTTVRSARRSMNVTYKRRCKKYSEYEIRLLSNTKYSNQDLSKLLNRDVETIHKTRRTLGITGYPAGMRKFTEDEIAKLYDLSMSNADLAKMLDRDIHVIYAKRRGLGITGYRNRFNK